MWRAAALSSLGGLGLLVACAPPPPTQPTVQSAATQAVATAQSGATAAAPTVAAAQTQVAPTVSAAQTQIAPTAAVVSAAVQATATALAPTAQAVATHVAPTVQAAVSTSVAESPVHVTAVNVSATDTTVAVQNSSTSRTDLGGWTLVMGPAFAIRLPDGINLDPGQTVTFHFSLGATTPTDFYVGYGSNLASNNLSPGTHVVLVAPRDEIASVYTIS